MTELELLVDFHVDGERQGPGSEKETLLALNLIDLPDLDSIKIADIGCGSGSQTRTIARNTNSEIIALDLFPEFLEQLNWKSQKMGLQDKIRTVQGTMEKLPFAQEELDLIWSEGAIYIMGFERGIQEWKQYLKRGGYLVVSEINWLTNSRPKELEEFWNSQYAEMQTSSQKIQILENNGYKPVGYFVVSEQSWIENYYKPMEGRYLSFLEKHKNSEMAKRIVEEHQQEFQQYQDYKDFYSYGFYIAQKME